MKTDQISSENINTGIVYLTVPERPFQLVQPRQSLDFKSQIEQDFSLRYQHFTREDFPHLNSFDIQRYQTSYENLHQQVLQSIYRIIDFNEEILQTKHSIKYHMDILPILFQNHQLAKREKKILYQILTNTWQRFDERIQNEINIQQQLEQIRKEHQHFLQLKIQQEKSRQNSLRIEQLNEQINDLKHEIQHLFDYKRELTLQMQTKQSEYTHHLIQLDYLKSTRLRHHLNQFNTLQLERDSLVTQIELIKYNLFEQIQENDEILRTYRRSLNHFRLTITELEQQLKQQTDLELNHFQISHEFTRLTIHDDTEKLITIFDRKIDEKKSINQQFEYSIKNFHEKILQQKQFIIKKENDLQTMEQIEQQLNSNIRIFREIYLQLKIERRNIERQLKLKLKEFTTDDRLRHTLVQQCESLIARKRIEQIRVQTSHEQLSPLIDENLRLKMYSDQLEQQSTKIHSKKFHEFEEQLVELTNRHRICRQENLRDQSTRKNLENFDEHLQRKTNQITVRMKKLLEKFHENHRYSQDNLQHIENLDQIFNDQQHLYLEENSRLQQMTIRLQIQHNQRNHLEKQLEIASKNIEQFQYRLQTFVVQMNFVQDDISRKKLEEYHLVLKQRDKNQFNRLSRINLQLIHREKQVNFSRRILQETNEELNKCQHVKLMFTRMIVRRGNLCRLLYRKLIRSDQNLQRQKKNMQMLNKSIQFSINQIQQIRKEIDQIIQRKDQIQFEVILHHSIHVDHSHQKQEVFQRNYFIKHSPIIDRLPTEEFSYLEKKFSALKTRLITMIYRGMIGNLVLFAIQQEFTEQLHSYTSTSKRKNYNQLNILRVNLCQLMRQFKSKSAELNMLINYQDYFQWIRNDTLEIVREISCRYR